MKQLRLSVQKLGQPPALVPLGDLVSYQRNTSPSEINRQDLSREVVLSANLGKLPLGSAMTKIKEVMKDLKMAPGYKVVFSGEGEDMVESFGYMTEALILAILFVYLILASQFESFIDPLAIMLSLPLSLVGMAGMLYLTGDTINMMSLIGLIMLMGLVTENAILLGGLYQGPSFPRDGTERGHYHRRSDQVAAHHDDHPGHDLRHAASGPGPGFRGGDAGPHGPGGDRRADHLHFFDFAGSSGGLLPT